MTEEFLTWCDDLHQVKGNVSQFQATLNQVLAKAPLVTKYRELLRAFDDKETVQAMSGLGQLGERLRVSLHSPQVKVAVRLKQLFDKGSLPFMSGLTRINFKSAKSDRYVGYLLDYQPGKSGRGDILLQGDEDKAPRGETENEAAPFPPNLPPIDNKAVMKLILTDKSLRQPSDFLESETSENGSHDFNNLHNRKLALKGRRVLELALWEVLETRLPAAHEDDIQFLLRRLMAKPILAKLAYCYNLPERVHHLASAELALEDKMTVFQNVLLAYIGGMSRAHYSFREIKGWISKLYEPLVAKVHGECYENGRLKNVASVALAEFHFLMARVTNALAGDPTKKIRYEFTVLDHDPVVVKLSVGDKDLATGTGATEMDARRDAALNTFNDLQIKQGLLEYFITHYRTQAEGQEGGGDDENKLADSEDDYDPEALDSKSSEPPSTSGPPSSAHTPASSQSSQGQSPTAPIEVQQRKPLPYGVLPAIPGAKKGRRI